MKKVLFFILAFCPLLAFGQKATEAQKQEALAAATKLCSLLSQYSNGGITYLSNDQKIFNLCSTPKISTFDDISAQKEVFLNSYLALITKKYKNHLKMTFSVPVIKESYAIPIVSLVNKYVHNEGAIIPILTQTGYSDIFVLMEVKQFFPLMRKETNRIIIYSLNEGKIISFSNKNSPFVSYCKALEACGKAQYTQSLSFCDKALNVERFDYKSDCAYLAVMNCERLNDYNRINCYTKYLSDDAKELMKLVLCTREAFDKGDEKAAFDGIYKLASLEWPNYLQYKGNFQAMLASMYATGIGCEKSKQKAQYYYECAVKNKSFLAGCCMILDKESGKIDVGNDVIVSALRHSASNGFIPAYYFLAGIDSKHGETEQEGEWYRKGAEQGDLMGMIFYGCWLSAIKHNKQGALYWLNKAYSDTNLSIYLENQVWENDVIGSAEDIKQLVYKVENNIPIPPPVPLGNTESVHQGSNATNSASSSSMSSSASTSTTTSSTSASYNRYNQTTRRGFNMPFNEHGLFGISVGYVQKQWVAKEDGETTKMGFWDDTKYMSGIQAGVRVEPLLKYGFGIDTGLYYEYYYSKSKSMSYEGTEYEPSIEEHSLYLPLHLEYRLNFSSKFQMFFYGGIGLDYVLSAKVKTNNEDLMYDEDDAYENANLKKFNTSLEYGGGIRVYGIQLNFTLTDGLLNINKDSDANVKQHKSLMCSLSYMF